MKNFKIILSTTLSLALIATTISPAYGQSQDVQTRQQILASMAVHQAILQRNESLAVTFLETLEALQYDQAQRWDHLLNAPKASQGVGLAVASGFSASILFEKSLQQAQRFDVNQALEKSNSAAQLKKIANRVAQKRLGFYSTVLTVGTALISYFQSREVYAKAHLAVREAAYSIIYLPNSPKEVEAVNLMDAIYLQSEDSRQEIARYSQLLNATKE